MADQDRLTKRRQELTLRVYRARLNFMSIGILTLVNMILCLVGTKWELPFYLCIPYAATLMVKSFVGHPEYFGQMISWILFGGAYLVAAVWMLVKSMKTNGALRGLSVLTWLDTAANVGLIVLSLFQSDFAVMRFSLILNLLFHIFVLVYVSRGSRAAKGLKLLPTKEQVDEDADPYAGFGDNGIEEPDGTDEKSENREDQEDQ
ncbi:MAG: hypothetical protein ACI3YK_00540 [Eubacteriales bacterium]